MLKKLPWREHIDLQVNHIRSAREAFSTHGTILHAYILDEAVDFLDKLLDRKEPDGTFFIFCTKCGGDKYHLAHVVHNVLDGFTYEIRKVYFCDSCDRLGTRWYSAKEYTVGENE